MEKIKKHGWYTDKEELRIAMEFGYKECERGSSIQLAKDRFEKVAFGSEEEAMKILNQKVNHENHT